MTDLATYGLRTQIDTMKDIAAAREKLVREQAEVIAKMREALTGAMVIIDTTTWAWPETENLQAAFNRRRNAIIAALALAEGRT